MGAYEASIDDEAIWTKRVGMEMLMRGKKLPEDKEDSEAVINAGGNWIVVCPDTVGSRDKSGGAQAGDQGKGSQGSVGKGRKAAETPLKNPNWARRGPHGDQGQEETNREERMSRATRRGKSAMTRREMARREMKRRGAEWTCQRGRDHSYAGARSMLNQWASRRGYDALAVCATQEAAKQPRRPALYSCEKLESNVWFQGPYPISMCAVEEQQGHDRGDRRSPSPATPDRQAGVRQHGGHMHITPMQQAEVMVKMVSESMKAVLRVKQEEDEKEGAVGVLRGGGDN